MKAKAAVIAKTQTVASLAQEAFRVEIVYIIHGLVGERGMVRLASDKRLKTTLSLRRRELLNENSVLRSLLASHLFHAK